jgi:hypothetical protein
LPKVNFIGEHEMNSFTVTLVSQVMHGKGQVFLNFDAWSGTVDFYVTSGVVVNDPLGKDPVRKILAMPWLHTDMPYLHSIPLAVKDCLKTSKIQQAIYDSLVVVYYGRPVGEKVVVEIEPIVRVVNLSKQRQAVIDADGYLLALRELEDWEFSLVPASNGDKLLMVILSDFQIPDEELLYELTKEQQEAFEANPYVYELRA